MSGRSGAGGGGLRAVLTAREAGALSATTAKKLEALLDNLNKQHDENVKKIQNEMAKNSEKWSKSENMLGALESQLALSNVELNKAHDNVQLLKDENNKLRKDNYATVDEKNNLQITCNRLSSNIGNLATEITELKNQLKKAIEEKCVVLSKSDELQHREQFLESKEQNFEKEKVHLNEQIQILTKDLSKYSVELKTIQSESDVKLSSLQSKLLEESDKLRCTNDDLINIKKANDQLSLENEKLKERLLSREDFGNSMLNDCKKELEAKTKLIDLYVKTTEEVESKNDQLNNSLSNLQTLYNSAIEQTQQFNESNNKLKTDFDLMLNENKSKILSLEVELNEAKTRLAASKEESLNYLLKELSPFASSTCELIKNKSLTQIYREIVTLSEQLVNEKQSAAKHSLRVETLSKENEEKDVIIREKINEIKALIETNANLQKNLELVRGECDQLKSKNEEITNSHNVYVQENKKLKNEVTTLSRQICFLADEKQVEESSPNESNTSLPDNLITFSNIKELQENNLKLLNLVNDLQQNAVHDKYGQNIKQYQSTIDSLNKQINQLLESQNVQTKFLKAANTQRDHFEKLYLENCNLNKSTSQNEAMETDQLSEKNQLTNVNTNKSVDSTELTETKRLLKEQSEKYNKYRTAMLASEKILTENLEIAKNELQEMNDKYAKCFSVSVVAEQKCETLEKTSNAYKTQISALEGINKTYANSLIKQEECIKYLRDELLAAITKCSTSEIMLENIQQEYETLKDSKTHIKKEINRTKEAQYSLSLLVKDIELFNVSEERKTYENILNLKAKFESSVKECHELQSKINSQKDQIVDLNSKLEVQEKQYHNRYEEANLIIEKNKTEILSLYDQMHNKTNQIEELNKKLVNFINTNMQESNSDILEKVKDLEQELIKHNNEMDSLRQQLMLSKQESQEYKSKFSNTDEELKKMDVAFKEYKNVMEATLNALRESEKTLKEKTSKLEAELSFQPRDINIMNASDLKTELIQSKKVIDDLKSELEQKSDLLSKFKTEISDLKDVVQKTEQKFTHEMMLHSTDVRTLSQLKLELNELKSTISKQMSENNQLKMSLRESTSTWEAREKNLMIEQQNVLSQMESLNQQNTLLHEEIQVISNQNVELRKYESLNESITANVSLNQSLNADDEKSLAQLMNIIKLLRREKEILNTKLDIIEAEKSRFKSELNIMTEQLDQLKQSLIAEKEKSKTKDMTVNSSEVTRKIEALNALTDSNVLLRKERDNLLKQVNELSEKSSKNEVALSSLEKSYSDIQLKVDVLQSENTNLRTESIRWKNRVATLVEKANKTNPEDWKRLQNERETLAKMLTSEKENAKKLNDEIASLKASKIKMDDEVNATNQKNILLTNNFKKQSEELNTVKSDITKVTQEMVEAKSKLEEKINALNSVNENLVEKEKTLDEISKREMNIRKIAKKYKLLYDELVKTNSENKAEDKSISKTQDDTSIKVVELTSQINKYTEENGNLLKEISNLRTIVDAEEKTKQQLADANLTISQLTESNTSLNVELSNVKDAIQKFEQNSNDNSTKLNDLKLQYDEHITRLEKERNQCELDKNSLSSELNKKIEYLQLKIQQIHRRQDCSQPKPSTSSYQDDQSLSEVPTTAKVAAASVVSTISSSASSYQNLTENLPSSSSPTCHTASQFHINIIPPESTQEFGINNLREVRSEAPENSALAQNTDGHQAVSINTHVETASASAMEAVQTHQAASSSCTNINNSNSTVTTSHRNDSNENKNRSKKRLQSPDDTSDRENRSKLQRLAEIENDYQLPTSSQRDQEDDCVIVDSGDDDDDKTVDRDMRNKSLETQLRNSSTENNEVELMESVPQGDSNSNRLRDSCSISNNVVIPASPINQQQIETISSVTEGNDGGNGYLSLGMGNVGSAGTSYDDGSDSIVPSTPVLYVPRRNDGFGEAVSSPLTISGGPGTGGHFTFGESDSGPTSGVIEDTHADLTNQIAPHLPVTPESENVPVQESSEAEVGGSSQESAGEGSPMVSSQGSLPASPQQMEESSEAEASSTAIANSATRKGPWTRASHTSPQTSDYNRPFSQRSSRQLRPSKGKQENNQFKRNQS